MATSYYAMTTRFASFLFFIASLLSGVDAAQQCERLKASATYTQEEAPRDLNAVFPVVMERINRVLEGVVDVDIEWKGGDLHGRVGEHFVQCKVTRLASALKERPETTFQDALGREVMTQCFQIPFTILDTNECTLGLGHPMRHRCHESTICVNTIGSYECLCPRMEKEDTVPGTADSAFWDALATQDRGPWELSFDRASRTSCPSMASTHGCCPEYVHIKDDAASCRAAFRCPVDPCSSKNTCSSRAKCVRKENPLDEPNYVCQCPEGLMGNGRKCRPGLDLKPEPKLMFDGKTPTEETLKNNYYCDCTKPIVDACSGFPPCKGKHQICTVTAGNKPICACKPGYVEHEKYGCVDESPPLLRLRNDPNGDQILRLKQGDVYKEYAVDVQDENAEEYLRSLKIAYSQPLPHGCLTKIGEFHVNYTVATPWTSPPYVRITRRVIIEDTDECKLDVSKYEKTCPELVPRCDVGAGATCVNTIGSYTCKCPKFTSGDGFQQGLSFEPLNVPDGFQGGTGCHDTGKPVINLVGPNPKVFRICECGGITGIMGKKGPKDEELKSAQQQHYGNDIRDLIQSTSGAELCATHLNQKPVPSDCVKSYDETYKGRVDLSREVIVGEPVKKSPLRWSVPYNVKDAAGNAAVTVWRDVVVEEVQLADVEAKIRSEVMQHQKDEVQLAVDRAVEADRKKRGRDVGGSRDRKVPANCPDCPPCNCAGKFEESMCEAACQAKMESCTLDEQSFVVRSMLWLEGFFPPWMVPNMLFCAVFTGLFFMLRLILTLIFNPQAYRADYYDSIARERAMQNAVTYYQGDGRSNGPVSALDPRSSLSTGNNNGYFTPRAYNPAAGQYGLSAASSRNASGQRLPGDDYDDIYESPSIITPSKRGDGVRKRSPYNSGIR